jgi:anti-sigma regulatory factor (Ser/Thr protein kinase)
VLTAVPPHSAGIPVRCDDENRSGSRTGPAVSFESGPGANRAVRNPALVPSSRGQKHVHERSTDEPGMSVMTDQLSAEPLRRPTSGTYPRSSGQARNIVRGYLSALRPPATPETVDRVLLVVSELVTNAHRHAGGLSAFRLSGRAGNLHVQVTDPSPVLPYARPAGTDTGFERGGFGWSLVQHLASEVTVHREPGGGKTIDALIR